MTEPFLKWPGGKRWLVSQHSHLFPAHYTRYVEPFLGSAAVFFKVAPSKSILADSNSELINAYRCVREASSEIEAKLRLYQRRHSKALFYTVRDTDHADRIGRAARFIYLNRTCFNGMYRVNREGRFNVPIGTKTTIAFPDGYLSEVAKALRGAQLKVLDFEKTLDLSADGDFAFVDPPYTVMHNNNGFIKYNANLFSWEDQVRLSRAVKRAAARGVSILLSNADHADIRDLYAGFGEHLQMSRASILSGTSSGRRATTELLVRSYNKAAVREAS